MQILLIQRLSNCSLPGGYLNLRNILDTIFLEERLPFVAAHPVLDTGPEGSVTDEGDILPCAGGGGVKHFP